MAAPKPTAGPKPRYRVVCYELIGENSNVIMDDTSEGFIAATGTITRGVMTAELLTAGPNDVQAHLAITIADDKLLARLTGRHSQAPPR
jgi:hypothetical protein